MGRKTTLEQRIDYYIMSYGLEPPVVLEMTKTMLGLKEIIKPDDTADAVAIAITHGLSVNTRKLMGKFDKG